MQWNVKDENNHEEKKKLNITCKLIKINYKEKKRRKKKTDKISMYKK